MPSGVVEIHSVPTLRSLRLKHLPIRVLDLEREERGEHRRHTQRLGRTVLQLLNLQFHLTHIHRHRVTSTRLPSISKGVERLERVDAIFLTEINVVVSTRNGELGNGLEKRTTGAATSKQLPRVFIGIGVRTVTERHQTLASSTHLHTERHRLRDSSTRQLRSRDLIRRDRTLRRSRSSNPTRVLIQMNASGKSGSNRVAHVLICSLGNDLSHLNIFIRTFRSRIHQISRFHHRVICIQEQRLDLPRTSRRISRSKVLKLELVVGCVVAQVNALLLTSQRVHQSTDVLQQNPVTRVASIDLELRHRLLESAVVVLDLHRTDPLTTIVLQNQNNFIGAARRRISSITIVHIEGIGRSIHTRRADRVLPDVGLGLVGHQTDNGIEG